jgi:hypothetical protein
MAGSRSGSRNGIFSFPFLLIPAAKVRLSEDKAKEKAFFLWLYRTEVPSATAKGTIKLGKCQISSRVSIFQRYSDEHVRNL